MQAPSAKKWDRFRLWATLLVAILPLGLVVVDVLRGGGWLSDSAVLSIIVVQLSLLTGVAYEAQLAPKREEAGRPGEIKEQEPFWSRSSKIGSLDVWALNGDRFVEALLSYGIRVRRLRLMLPSAAAVREFYAAFSLVPDENHAVAYIEDGIANVEVAVRQLKATGQVLDFDVRRVHAFPLQFYAVADGNASMHGVYEAAPDRPMSVGLRSRCWTRVERDAAEVLTAHFEGHWIATRESTNA